MPDDPLTRLELEMLNWRAAGYNRKKTALKMGVSSRACDRLVAKACKKLNARNAVEMISKAYTLGIVW